MVKEEFYTIFKTSSRRSFWCWLGFHKWLKCGGMNIFSSNIKEHYYMCERCRKRKTVYIPKNNLATKDASIRKENVKIWKWR
jgi:hypothetical protein